MVVSDIVVWWLVWAAHCRPRRLRLARRRWRWLIAVLRPCIVISVIVRRLVWTANPRPNRGGLIAARL